MLQVDFPEINADFRRQNRNCYTTYQNVCETQLFDEGFRVTDSEIILKEITKIGGKAVMTSEHKQGSDRIAEVVQNIDCDIVINVQGDEPFLKTEPLKQLIQVFKMK